AALVARLLEQLEAALEVIERQLEVALPAPDAAELVERDRGLAARRRDPGQAQHPLERRQRRLPVALQLVHRAEVVPEAHARREVALAGAGEGARVQADGAVVEIVGARGVGGAPVAGGGRVGLAGELEVARDLLERLLGAPLGAELEPLRQREVVWPR